jgi:hypothetical protein
MPLSYVLYTSQTGTGPFLFTFPYISLSHVKVKKNGTALTLTTDYTISTSPSPRITLVAPLVAADILQIYRETPGLQAAPNNVPIVDYSNGSVLTADDLDKSNQQMVYLVQESNDTGSGALGRNISETAWDAKNLRITNLGAPLTASDAVTRSYVDGLSLYGTAIANPQSWAFSGTGATTSFTLSSPAPATTDANMFIVEVGGVLQRPTTNYTVSGAGVLTFVAAPPAGTSNIVVRNFGTSRNVLSFNAPIDFGGHANFTDGATVNNGLNCNSDLNVGGPTYNLNVNTTSDRVGILTNAPEETLDVRGNIRTTGDLIVDAKQLIGGIGAETTGGTLDWDHETNARSGSGYTLLLPSTSSNGPLALDGVDRYFHPFSFEYNSKNGNGNMTQFAIPYNSPLSGIHYRTRFSGTWSAWSSLVTQPNLATPNLRVDTNGVGIKGGTSATHALNVAGSVASTGIAVTGTASVSSTLSVGGATTCTGVINANGNIQFPATIVSSANANTLDAYVEATHTIENADFGGSTTNGSYTLSAKTINYTRIGNRIFGNCTIALSAITTAGTGTIRIRNLPWSAQDSSWSTAYWVNLASNVTNLIIGTSGSQFDFYYTLGGGTTPAAFPPSLLAATSSFRFEFSLRVAT